MTKAPFFVSGGDKLTHCLCLGKDVGQRGGECEKEELGRAGEGRLTPEPGGETDAGRERSLILIFIRGGPCGVSA